MSVKIVLDFLNQKATIEGAEDSLIGVVEAIKALAPSLSEISIVSSSKPTKTPDDETPPHSHQPGGNGRKKGLREFAKGLILNNMYEKIAAIAYHAIIIEGKDSFSVKEMNSWFSLCGFPKPSQMPVALSDARRNHDYITSKGRDQWTITTGGENLILEKIEATG